MCQVVLGYVFARVARPVLTCRWRQNDQSDYPAVSASTSSTTASCVPLYHQSPRLTRIGFAAVLVPRLDSVASPFSQWRENDRCARAWQYSPSTSGNLSIADSSMHMHEHSPRLARIGDAAGLVPRLDSVACPFSQRRENDRYAAGWQPSLSSSSLSSVSDAAMRDYHHVVTTTALDPRSKQPSRHPRRT